MAFAAAFDLDAGQLAILIAVVLLAAVARGYSGFGFSAIVIAAASLFVAPAKLVPVLFALEVGASIHMLPSVRHDIDPPTLWPLLGGCAIGLPAGLSLLAHLPADAIRIALSVGVAAAAVLIWRGVSFGRPMNRTIACVTGLVTGFGSGLAAIGGLLMIVILLGTNYPAARTRAMCVTVFLVMYVYGIALSALNGLVSVSTVQITLLLFVPLAAGIMIGQRRYLSTSAERFRQFTLLLLFVLALIGIARALLL